MRFQDKELQRVLGKHKIVPTLMRARAGDMILWDRYAKMYRSFLLLYRSSPRPILTLVPTWDSRVVHSGTPGWFSGLAEKQGGSKRGAVGGRTFPNLAQDWQVTEYFVS